MIDFSSLPPAGDAQASRSRLQFCAAHGLVKHAIAREHGGQGDSFYDLIHAHQALGEHCQDSGLILSLNAHLWGSVFPLLLFGTEPQRQTWLPALLSGEHIGGHAITEPHAGSDVNAMTTSALQTEAGFVLNGHKRFITNTPIADVLLIYAKLNGKISAFLVKKTDAGVNFTAEPQVTGCATATMGDVLLDNCLISLDRQLGKSGAGTMMIQAALELERAFVFAGLSGIMEKQLQTVLAYSRQRLINQRLLGSLQAISHKIAEMKLRLDSVNLWLNECARLKEAHKRLTLASAQTKLFASEAFVQSSLDAVQIMGASGLMPDHFLASLVNDALTSRLFSGSSEIQKNSIAGLLGIGDGLFPKTASPGQDWQ
jgi:alkylation response protein AidB-like acyl-CoA dehydrogenase